MVEVELPNDLIERIGYMSNIDARLALGLKPRKLDPEHICHMNALLKRKYVSLISYIQPTKNYHVHLMSVLYIIEMTLSGVFKCIVIEYFNYGDTYRLNLSFLSGRYQLRCFLMQTIEVRMRPQILKLKVCSSAFISPEWQR
jgi:hypothetical protein